MRVWTLKGSYGHSNEKKIKSILSPQSLTSQTFVWILKWGRGRQPSFL